MRMIPCFLDEESPPGERIVFANLQNGTRNWVALHSLDLAPDNRNRRTELDFVLIIPDKGILCVEVKSQKHICFDGAAWQPESLKRNPFKQALDARFAFRRRLESNSAGRYSHVPVVHCCIFPFSDFSVNSNVSIKPWEFLDRRLTEQCRTPDEFGNAILRVFAQAVENDPQVSALKAALTEGQVEEIVNICYPIRKRKPERREEIERRKIEIDNKLRVQQKPVMTLCDLNSRVLVQGGAGTGKSLIGIEVAKRKAETGSRVAYLCFNRLIGKSAEKELALVKLPNLIAGSAYSVLLKLTGVDPPVNADGKWWEEQAPVLIEEKLTDPEFEGVMTFDYLVIDEAQDMLARPSLWACIQLMLEEGSHSYLVLGDFVNQFLTTNFDVIKDSLRELMNKSAHWCLEENCRNYRSIGQAALALSACSKTTWSGYLREGGSLHDWSFHTYSHTGQLEKIRECIQRARNDGFRDQDITLLTFCAISRSVVKRLVASGFVVEKAQELDSPHIRYSTISAFKGMENKVIIITDVMLTPQNQELERRVFYTGMTRATERLHIVCRETSARTLQKWALSKDGEK